MLLTPERQEMDNSCPRKAKGPNVSSRSTPFCSRSLTIWHVQAVIEAVRWFTSELFSVLKFWPVIRGVKGGTSNAEPLQFSQSSFSDLIKGETTRGRDPVASSANKLWECAEERCGKFGDPLQKASSNCHRCDVCSNRLVFLRSVAFVVNDQRTLSVKSYLWNALSISKNSKFIISGLNFLYINIHFLHSFSRMTEQSETPSSISSIWLTKPNGNNWEFKRHDEKI